MSYLDFALREIPKFAGSYLINLKGSIDAATAIEFQSYLENLKKRGAKHFLLDLNSIRFINSTGLSILVNFADESKNNNGSLGLINIHSKLRIVFTTLGLDNFLDIFNNLTEGLQFIARTLPVDEQITIVEQAQQILTIAPEKKSAEIADKTIPSPVIAMSINAIQEKVRQTGGVSASQTGVRAQPMKDAQKVASSKVAAPPPKPSAPQRRIQPPQPVHSPPPSKTPTTSSGVRGNTKVIGKPAKQKVAYILISPKISNFGAIYSQVQSACLAVNVISTRIDHNDPNYLEKAFQLISRVNFVIADFSLPDNFLLQQASYARFQIKPPKPLLGIIQGLPTSLPSQWQKTSFINYKMTKEGLARLKIMLQQTISRAITKL